MTIKVTFNGQAVGEVAAMTPFIATPAAPKPRTFAPQWRYRVGEAVRYVCPNATDDEHYGQTGAVIERWKGYLTNEDKEIDTGGGCYLVRFQCGCVGHMFEHWLTRGDERACVQ